MKILQARNPIYTEDGQIDIEVLFEDLAPEWVQFTASPDDSEEHGRTLYKNAVSGMYGAVAPFVPEPVVLEDEKELKLSELKSAFETASNNAHCMSSLGFEINADAVAKRNIDSLIEVMEYSSQETEMFRGYDNEFHRVTVDDLKVMRIEVINNGNALYQRKWTLEAQIEDCGTVEELNAIVIDFEV